MGTVVWLDPYFRWLPPETPPPPAGSAGGGEGGDDPVTAPQSRKAPE